MSRRPKRVQEVVPKLRHIYAYLADDLHAQRGLIAGSLLALVVGVLFRLLEPWPLKVFLDTVIPISAGRPARGLFADWPTGRLLLGIAIATVAFTACRAVADYLSCVGFFNVGNRVIIKIRDRLFRHLQDLSMAFHARSRTGDLVIRVTRDVSLLRDVTATAVLPLIGSVAILCGMLMVMLFLSWPLTLLTLTTVPLFWLSSLRLGQRIREAARKQRQREGVMANTAAEALGAIQMIKAIGLEQRFAQMFSQRNRESQKQDLRANRLSVRLGRTIDILLALATALVLYFGGRLVLAGSLTPGDVVVFLTYLKRSFKPAEDFAKYTARLAKAAAAGERVIDLLNRRPEITDLPDAQPAPAFQGHLRFDDVTFGFRPDRSAIAGVSLRVERGELLALVGPSGGGKTTILGHVLRMYDPNHGRVLIDDTDIKHFTRQSLRDQISSVMQDAVMLAASIHDNIACGCLHEVDRDAVMAAARLANADEFIRQIPEGYDAMVGERGATLSRGQRQRLAIARAAIRQAPFLLLDEPTAGLDEENEQIVVEALLRLAKGRTALLVTHCLSLAARADRIVFVEAGRILEQGPHAALLQQNGRYAKWHDRHALRGGRHTPLSVYGG